mmetsp:Transcript_87500/g.274023  ORF Transcript_87500/g.274023 Transcript_87500/m.274023 type:complete len:201 (-) Transcript_87500:2309-2911(-)
MDHHPRGGVRRDLVAGAPPRRQVVAPGLRRARRDGLLRHGRALSDRRQGTSALAHRERAARPAGNGEGDVADQRAQGHAHGWSQGLTVQQQPPRNERQRQRRPVGGRRARLPALPRSRWHTGAQRHGLRSLRRAGPHAAQHDHHRRSPTTPGRRSGLAGPHEQMWRRGRPRVHVGGPAGTGLLGCRLHHGQLLARRDTGL